MTSQEYACYLEEGYLKPLISYWTVVLEYGQSQQLLVTKATGAKYQLFISDIVHEMLVSIFAFYHWIFL